MTVSPLIVEESLAAGESTSFPLKVSNQGTAPLSLRFEHADFGFRNGYELTFIEDTASRTVPFSTRGWFSADQKALRLKPGASRELTVTIRVPDSAASGSYLGAAFVRAQANRTGGDGATVRTATRSGTLVFITVEGGGPPAPVLDAVEVDRLQTSLPVRATITVGNEGGSHFMFSGSAKLAGRGDTRTTPIVDSVVMPGLDRRLSLKIGEPDSDEGTIIVDRGGTDAAGEDDDSGGPLGIGRYTLTVSITPSGHDPLSRSVSFWYVPLWLCLVLAFVGAMVVAAVVWGLVHEIRRFRASRRPHEAADEESAHDDEPAAIDDLDLHDGPDEDGPDDGPDEDGPDHDGDLLT